VVVYRWEQGYDLVAGVRGSPRRDNVARAR
jgi:hypothetical protein